MHEHAAPKLLKPPDDTLEAASDRAVSGSRRASLGTSPRGSPERSRSARLLGADGPFRATLGGFAPREAQIRIAAQWKKPDLQAVAELVAAGSLSLDGLITHTYAVDRAREAYDTAFGDPQCLKMVLDWRN